MPVDPAVLRRPPRPTRATQLTAFTTGDALARLAACARQFHRYCPQQPDAARAAGRRRPRRLLPHLAAHPRRRRRPLPGPQRRDGPDHPRPDDRHPPRDRRSHRRGDHRRRAPSPGSSRSRCSTKASSSPRPISPTRRCPSCSPATTAGSTSGPPCNAQLDDAGYPVELSHRSPVETWNGRTHFDRRPRRRLDHLEPPARLKTLLHEWAHVDAAPRRRLDRPDATSGDRSRIGRLPRVRHDRPRLLRATRPLPRRLVRRRPRARSRPPPNGSSPPPPPWSTPSNHDCRSTSLPTCSASPRGTSVTDINAARTDPAAPRCGSTPEATPPTSTPPMANCVP